MGTECNTQLKKRILYAESEVWNISLGMTVQQKSKVNDMMERGQL